MWNSIQPIHSATWRFEGMLAAIIVMMESFVHRSCVLLFTSNLTGCYEFLNSLTRFAAGTKLPVDLSVRSIADRSPGQTP